MGSFYIVISVPSAEHEKILWTEKNLDSQRTTKKLSSSIPQNKSAASFDDCSKSLNIDSEVFLTRSASDDSSLLKKKDISEDQDGSSIYVEKNKIPTEKKLENCLKELNITNAVWVLGRAGRYYQVSFCTPAGEQCENIIQLLNEHKIGVEQNSTVSILPCSLYYEGKEHTITPNKASHMLTPSSAAQKHSQSGKEVTAWERFVNSVRARLMVAQVVSGVRDNSLFTFDFLILLIIAAMTAAVGLVENSVVILVASMLISPLMGPVMAGTFGFVIRDWKLQSLGVLNELLGLLLCVLIGFLYGLIIGYLSWEVPDVIWPTPEMLNRGELRSLWVGALIALISGAAVAIAVLGNYSGSLTGVAISASLMPPAVNAGLLWALAVVTVVLGNTNPKKLDSLTTGDPVKELIVLGALSLALTFINIVCIFFTGILVLKIKEVTPRGSKDYSKLLWKETIQIAKDYKYNLPQTERIEQGTTPNQFTNLFSTLPYKMDLNQYTWSAYGAMNRMTVEDLTSAWHQLTLTSPDIRHTLIPRGKGRTNLGSPLHHSNLEQRNLFGSPSTVYTNLNDQNITSTAPASVNTEPRRFTVTPTITDDVDDIDA